MDHGRFLLSMPQSESWYLYFYHIQNLRSTCKRCGCCGVKSWKRNSILVLFRSLHLPSLQQGKFVRQAPPGRAHEFCKKHPDSNGCIYHRLPRHLLDEMGWQDFQILRGGILNIGGVRIGFAPGLHFFCVHDPASFLSATF